MIPLIKPVRRRLAIRGNDYALTIDAGGVTLRPYGKRTGVLTLPWQIIEIRAAERLADQTREQRRQARRVGR